MRLDLELGEDGRGVVLISLSERNLLTLLAHLSQSERPNPMLAGGYVYRGGVLVDGVALVLHSEPNEVHYAEREAAGEPAGEMQPRRRGDPLGRGSQARGRGW